MFLKEMDKEKKTFHLAKVTNYFFGKWSEKRCHLARVTHFFWAAPQVCWKIEWLLFFFVICTFLSSSLIWSKIGRGAWSPVSLEKSFSFEIGRGTFISSSALQVYCALQVDPRNNFQKIPSIVSRRKIRFSQICLASIMPRIFLAGQGFHII